MTHPSSLPLIGSQLFINRTMTPEEASIWVKRMHQARFKRIRLFMVWDFLEPEPGQWNFSTYDAVFDTAAQLGLDIVPTLMSISPPGWMLRTGGVQAVANLEDTEVLEEGDRYLQTVVGRWVDHPALHSWILWNEASRVLPRNPATLAAFRTWLEKRFQGDVSEMNALQFRRYGSFSEVGNTHEERGMELEFATYAEGVLWLEFTVSELCRHLERIGDVVRSLDADHPLHVNPHNLCEMVRVAGQSIWKEAEVVDFLGCSSHPVWHASRFRRQDWLLSVGIFADLCRSASPHPDGEFWVSELQGGTTRLSAEFPDGPDATELARWMWAGIGAGASTTLFWCFNYRDEGYEAGEWALTRLDGSPSPRLDAATEVIHVLEQHEKWFGHTTPWQSDIWVLRSDAAERLAFVECREGGGLASPRNPLRVTDAATGTAMYFARLGQEVHYVEELGLASALEKGAPTVLVIPGLEVLSDGVLEVLLEYVRQGGQVVSDACPGFKDPMGRLLPSRMSLLEMYLGGPCLDLESWRGAGELPEDHESGLDPWWYRVVAGVGEEVEVFEQGADGIPLVWENRIGDGAILHLGTWFFHRFVVQEYPQTASWFETLLQKRISSLPFQTCGASTSTVLRHLRHPEGCVLIALDEGGGAEALVTAHQDGVLSWAGETVERVVTAVEKLVLPLDRRGIGYGFFTCT